MKRRLYYLCEDIGTVSAISEALHRAGVTDWNFHVVSKDEAGLYKHHVHSATPLLAQDVVRYGEYGTLVGLVAGIAVSGLVIGVFEFFRNQPLIAFLVITALVTAHGAWIGGMAGLSTENHKIKRFHNDIEAGRYLLMIDVARAQRQRVEAVLRQFAVVPQGESSPLVLPFSAGRT